MENMDSEIYNFFYNQYIIQVNNHLNYNTNDYLEYINFDLTIESNLDAYDLILSIIFGILGACISTNDSINEFCDKIHTNASNSSKNISTPDKLIGYLLNHNGDNMDQINGTFINRNNQIADIGFHRLLFGHDPLHFSEDNPFKLMFEQKGLKGILQAFRHLIADTFSKQGLPLPGHAYLDYTENGKLSNILRDLTMEFSNNNRPVAIKNFNHLFTIRAQDIASQGFVSATASAYFKFRNINDDIRKIQYRLISYSVNFFSHAAIGASRQNGVPYINWIAFVATLKELIKLFTHSNKLTKELEEKTNEIIFKNDILNQQIFENGYNLKSYNNSIDYFKEIHKSQESFDEFSDFFEGV